MSTPATRSTKPLDFGGTVVVKTDDKQSTYSKVRDIKKTLETISFQDVVIATSVARVELIAQYNFSIDSAWRIRNWENLQARVINELAVTAAPFIYEDMSIANIENVVFCVKFLRNGVTYRYKIAGRHQDYWDDFNLWTFDYPRDTGLAVIPALAQYEPAMAVVAPWYAGEKIEGDFVIEIWSASETLTNFNLAGTLNIQLNRLFTPSSLEETGRSVAGTQYVRTDLDYNLPVAIPIAFPAPTVGA